VPFPYTTAAQEPPQPTHWSRQEASEGAPSVATVRPTQSTSAVHTNPVPGEPVGAWESVPQGVALRPSESVAQGEGDAAAEPEREADGDPERDEAGVGVDPNDAIGVSVGADKEGCAVVERTPESLTSGLALEEDSTVALGVVLGEGEAPVEPEAAALLEKRALEVSLTDADAVEEAHASEEGAAEALRERAGLWLALGDEVGEAEAGALIVGDAAGESVPVESTEREGEAGGVPEAVSLGDCEGEVAGVPVADACADGEGAAVVEGETLALAAAVPESVTRPDTEGVPASVCECVPTPVADGEGTAVASADTVEDAAAEREPATVCVGVSPLDCVGEGRPVIDAVASSDWDRVPAAEIERVL
jgi:hypothetical protein